MAVLGPARVSPLKSWMRALELTAPINSHPKRTLPQLIQSLGQMHGDAPALLSTDEHLSYRQLAALSNQWSRWALQQRLAPGDTVGLLMPNCPQYMAIWLGITQVGVAVALLNTNLTGAALAHCIMAAGCKGVIVAPELWTAASSACPLQTADFELWCRGNAPCGSSATCIFVDGFSGSALTAAEERPISIATRALLIYTSGTTGLPKAASVSHGRLMYWSHWFAGMMHTGSSDRMYDCLPMYHSIGGVVATGALLVSGGSVFIAKRFSASRFWDEVCEQNCTIFQYIGELCRYLANSAPHPREHEHRLRLACGNGLASGIWPVFEQRFQIPQILEYYAATEANFSLYNCEGMPGAIGRIPPFLQHRFPVELVRHDESTQAPARGPDGRCINCGVDEPGEAISRIDAIRDASNGAAFEGYTDRAASEAKILRDVFAAGDAWYRSGDLMKRDRKGYFSFVDRVGDTFRWKGENVSTTEVAAAIAACPGVAEAVVYGVPLPGADGRAGMATVIPESDFDLALLNEHLIRVLPAYARPVMLRLASELTKTSTFRPVKQTLIREGFDPEAIKDPIYVRLPEQPAFTRLDTRLHQRILAGDARL